MVQIFTTILNMSITASFVIGLVLLIRLFTTILNMSITASFVD